MTRTFSIILLLFTLGIGKPSFLGIRPANFLHLVAETTLSDSTDLWVDAVNGNDNWSGITPGTAFRTIQQAANHATPGTTVHILPGIYRETVRPTADGSETAPIIYVAEAGSGTAILRGSESSQSLIWTPMTGNSIRLPPDIDPANIYVTDLSDWKLATPPRFIVSLDGNDETIKRLPLAREPDWQVTTEWKHHEFWWVAEGGSDVATCDPSKDSDPNCDFSWRSLTQLTDTRNDTDIPGIEPGNLTTLGDITGATLVAIDSKQGHYVYRRTIVDHDISKGRVAVDEICEHDFGSGDPGLGWGSKYYVENLPSLIDTPGEWWYDSSNGLLYLWPLISDNPSKLNIEISQRDNGFILNNRSHIILDGLTIELFNANTVNLDNNREERAYNNIIRNATLRYANIGIHLEQTIAVESPRGTVIDGFVVENSEISYMDTRAMDTRTWWDDKSDANSLFQIGISDVGIRSNRLHHLGFRSDDDTGNGATFYHADRLRFEDNHVHHVAHNGIQISKSIIQSDKKYNFLPTEIKTGEILIQNNIFEEACQLTTDCGALKLWGVSPDSHVFRDLFITGNTFRNTFGWTYVSEKRGRWSGGTTSEVQGMGGFGLYVDFASGIHVYRNIAYNNAYAGFMVGGAWRDGDMIFYNNIASNSLYGFRFVGLDYDSHENVNTQILNNIIVSNEGYGICLSDADGKYHDITIDNNLYFSNGWKPQEQGGVWKPGEMIVLRGEYPNEIYQTLSAIQDNTPWESHGANGDPAFLDYDFADHDFFDGSWPDFHITEGAQSTVDRGTTSLPPSLIRLLTLFKINESLTGESFDIGRYETKGLKPSSGKVIFSTFVTQLSSYYAFLITILLFLIFSIALGTRLSRLRKIKAEL